MSTEIIGYMGTVPASTVPTTREYKTITKPNRNKERSKDTLKNKLLGAVLIVLGTVTIPIADDSTAFVMCLLFGIAAIIGGNKNGD